MTLDEFEDEIAGFPIGSAIVETAEACGCEVKVLATSLLVQPFDIVLPDVKKGERRVVPFLCGHLWKGDTLGPRPCDIMVIGKHPGRLEIAQQRLFVGETSQFFERLCREEGLDPATMYVTNILRFPAASSRVAVKEFKQCAWLLHQEIRLVKPKYILLLGSDAVRFVLGRKLDDVRGTIIEHEFPYGVTSKIMATVHPAEVYSHSRFMELGLRRDLANFKRLVFNEHRPKEKRDWRIIRNEAQLDALFEELEDVNLVSLDCEWGGRLPDGQLRCIQFAWAPRHAAVIVLHDTELKPAFEPSVEVAAEKLKEFLLRPGMMIVGQNIRSDDHWIKAKLGFSILDRVVWDTMLADHILEENRSHKLEDMIIRFTDMQRYDVEKQEYVEQHKLDIEQNAFKGIPDEILLPYALGDADGTLRVMLAQQKLFSEQQFKLLQTIVLPQERALAEAEEVGFKIDLERLEMLSQVLRRVCEELEQQLREEAVKVGMENFNPRSYPQVKELLFKRLKLTPVKSTSDSPWFGDDSDESPSTDKFVLAALRNKHPIPKLLADYRIIYQPVSKLLKPFKRAEDGRIISEPRAFASYIDRDGYVRPEIRSTLKTGRRSTKNPNLQNLTGRRMERIREILGDPSIPSIRSIVVSPPGYLLVCADYAQAELVVLSLLAEDDELFAALHDPSRDLHAEQAIRMYDLPYKPEFGNPKDWCKSNGYGHLRDHAKTCNFGWAYLITPESLHMKMIEAGVDCTPEDCRKWLQYLDEAFPKCVRYKHRQMAAVKSPGYVVTPWSRVKHLYSSPVQSIQAGQERQAVNFAIQSTVADLTGLAMSRLQQLRDEHKMHYKICPDQHDNIPLYCPINEVETLLEKILPSALKIPIPGYGVSLDYEVSLYFRWGEAPSTEELVRAGLSTELAEQFGK